VVLLHGLLTDSRIWAVLAAEFGSDRTAIAIDAPGHGASPPRCAPFSLEEETAAIVQAVHASSASAFPAIWIGHSMGGMKAMRAALLRPDLVSALVLISTQPFREPEPSARVYMAMVETVVTDGMTPDLAYVIGRMNFYRDFLGDPVAVRWIEHFSSLTGENIEQPCYAVYRRDDISSAIGGITAPILVVHGAEDVPIKARVASAYSRLFPDASLVLLPGVGHTPPCERPYELARLVREFIAQLALPAGPHIQQGDLRGK
jgi:pimeloyl-ACP methyl ester carboxylesterase